jgi:hypothetical protein
MIPPPASTGLSRSYILVLEGVPTAFGGATCFAYAGGQDVTFALAVRCRAPPDQCRHLRFVGGIPAAGRTSAIQGVAPHGVRTINTLVVLVPLIVGPSPTDVEKRSRRRHEANGTTMHDVFRCARPKRRRRSDKRAAAWRSSGAAGRTRRPRARISCGTAASAGASAPAHCASAAPRARSPAPRLSTGPASTTTESSAVASDQRTVNS